MLAVEITQANSRISRIMRLGRFSGRFQFQFRKSLSWSAFNLHLSKQNFVSLLRSAITLNSLLKIITQQGKIMLPGTPKLLLEKILEMTGLSIAQLAGEIGISRPTLLRILLGKKKASLANNRRLISFYFHLVREKDKAELPSTFK